jgi:hypothetical protein
MPEEMPEEPLELQVHDFLSCLLLTDARPEA